MRDLLASSGQNVALTAAVPAPGPPTRELMAIELKPARDLKVDSARRTLTDSLNSSLSVVAVDDADWLDTASTHAILVAARRSGITVLTAARPAAAGLRGTSIAPYLSPSVRVVVPPWRPEEIDQLLRTKAGVALEPASLGMVASACGGLPGLSIATIRAVERRRGGLVRAGAQWRLAGSVWSPQLAPTIESVLIGLGEEARRALQVVAVAEALSVEKASLLPEAAQLELLETQGFVRVIRVRDVDELVVYPPILADHYRAESGQWRLREIERAAGGAFVTSSADLSGVVVGQSALLSHRTREFWQREARSRQVAWLEEPTPWAAYRYLTALGHIGAEPDQIAQVMSSTLDEGPDLDRVLLHTWWACHLGIVQDRVADAYRLLDWLRGELTGLDGAIRAVRAHITLVCSHAIDPVELTSAGADEHQLSFDFIRTVTAELWVARAMPEQALTALDGPGSGESLGLGQADDVVRGLAMFLAGDVEEATAWAIEQYESSRTALDVSWSEGHAYLAALGLALTGRLSAFDAHMNTVSSLVVPGSINVHFLAATFAFASVVATERGLKESALAYAEQALGFGLGEQVYPGIPARLAHVLATGDREKAGHAGWAATEQWMAAGCAASAVMVGMIALEHAPVRARAKQLTELAGQTGSALLKSIAAYAQELVKPAPERLRQVAGNLAEAGLMLYATRAGVRAALLFHSQGDARSAVEMADEMWSWFHRDDRGLAQLLRPLVDTIGVTDRERHILAMVASGDTPAQIADDLVLSVRTVEQHIHRMSRKLAVSGRESLAVIARTWMAAFIPDPPMKQAQALATTR
ncbi:MAG: LuxR C-terminal-related transcriptional regulator [Propionicimonas sp.]